MNLETISRGTRLGHSMDSILSVQNKNFSGDGKEFTKVSRTAGKAESHLHCQFIGIGTSCEDFILESLYVEHRTDQKHMKEQFAEPRKEPLQYCCNLAWMKNCWLSLWCAVAICIMFQTSRQMGKTHCERRIGEPNRKAWLFRLVQWLFFIRFLRRTSQGSTNLVRQFYQEYFLGYELIAGEIWKGDTWEPTRLPTFFSRLFRASITKIQEQSQIVSFHVWCFFICKA